MERNRNGWTKHYKLCENTKNYKSAYPGSNKVVHGACEQESKGKNFILIFEYAKLDFYKKNLLVQKKNPFFWLRFYVSQKKRLDE